MELFNYFVLGIYIIGYILIYRYQKAQFENQNSMMEKYKEVFSIINIDEIKKHIQLKEENLLLKYENQLMAMEQKLEESHQLIFGLKNLNIELKKLFDDKTEVNSLMLKSSKYIDDRKEIDEQIMKLYEDEFDEIYNFINDKLKLTDELKELDFENSVLVIRKDYLSKRLEVLKNRTILN